MVFVTGATQRYLQDCATRNIIGCVNLNGNLKNGQNEIVFDRLWYPLTILLLDVIGAKLIGPHGGLQVDKISL